MQRTDVIVIGAGQAGLAASACLSAQGLDHVVLERGAVGERWRNERWDSLRLLSPNWMTRLPGHAYGGPDPEGFMHKDEFVDYLDGYAAKIAAPVYGNAPVFSVARNGNGFEVASGAGTFRSHAVILATGACDQPSVPAWAKKLSPRLTQMTTHDYKTPGQIGPGGVLVVGASATGLQLAEEIHAAGHDVTIASGRHVSLPRRYRGRDIMDWMDCVGLFDEARNPNVSAARALRQPSMQLVGGTQPRSISLASLAAQDIRPISRIIGADGTKLRLSGTLGDEIGSAHSRMQQVLDRIDAHIADARITAPRPDRPARAKFVPSRHESLDLERAGIRTVLWATGFKRDYSWLNVPVLDAHGEIRESGGITEVPGLYALGLPFMRRRKSHVIDGVGQDAVEIVSHLAGQFGAASLPQAA